MTRGWAEAGQYIEYLTLEKAKPQFASTRRPRRDPIASTGSAAASRFCFRVGFKMTMKRMSFGLLICFAFIGTPAMAIEELKYTVSLHEGAYEVRDYQAPVRPKLR
jgi:hypothetical protein